MDSFDLSEQRIVQLEQIPLEIQHQIERGDGNEYRLDLSLNRLRSIDQIGVFEHVSQLDLSGNQLEHVNGIQALRRLQTLDLSRNCIATVDLLALLPALQVLKVAENSLTSVDALQLLPELRVVDASYNRITKWPPLAGLSLLETLDLSDNTLGAFPPSLSPTLFPTRLRRLSITRNQIDKLCGIACLGHQLPMLEFLAFDGNPIVIEIVRSGGQLERMLAAFFPCLPLSNDGGLTMLGRRHDEFTTPPHTLNTLKRAILEGREESLTEFLLTGSLAGQGSPGGFGSIFPPPPPVEHLPLHDTGNEQRAIDNTLSHDNKLEIWKRIQEDRKAQFGESSGFVPSSSSVRREKSVRWDQRVEQPVDIRAPALAAADLVTPEPTLQVMPALDASSLSVMKPLDTTILSTPSDPMKGSQAQNNADNEALVKKVKALTEQVVTMRKYMKVWVKREKMVREASARKIQRWLQRLHRNFQLRQRVMRSRQQRYQDYSFHHCSSFSMQNTNFRGATQLRVEALSAQILQSRVRGFIIRQRMKSFKKKHVAAIRIQRAWRKIVADRFAIFRGDQKLFRWNRSTTTGNQEFYFKWRGLLNGVVRCSQDVKQLQQVCAVQDDAINSLWSNQNSNDSMNKKNIIRFEVANPTFGDQTDAKADGLLPEMDSVSEVRNLKQQIDRQSIEIDTLKQQLESLQNVVASLASVKLENRLYRTSSMGNILSCYKVNKPDTCSTPTSNNQVVTPSVSFKADEGNVDQACENPKESDNFQGTPKFSKPAKDHTPLLSRGDSEAGHYSGRH